MSSRLGYRPAGHEVYVRRGLRAVEQRFVLDRASWEASERPAVDIEGLEGCRELFGA